MRKLLLGLGSVVAIVAPVAAVVACGSDSGKAVTVTNEQKMKVFNHFDLFDKDANNLKVTVQKSGSPETQIIVVSFNSLRAVAGHENVSALVKGTNTIKWVSPKTGSDSIFLNGVEIKDNDLSANLRWVIFLFLPDYRKAFPSDEL